MNGYSQYHVKYEGKSKADDFISFVIFLYLLSRKSGANKIPKEQGLKYSQKILKKKTGETICFRVNQD